MFWRLVMFRFICECFQNAFRWRSVWFWMKIGLPEKQTESRLIMYQMYTEKNIPKAVQKKHAETYPIGNNFQVSPKHTESSIRTAFGMFSGMLKMVQTVTDLSRLDQ